MKSYKKYLNDYCLATKMVKHTPNDSVNLAFVSSPTLCSDNINASENITLYNQQSATSEVECYADQNNKLNVSMPTDMIDVTDEYSLKRLSTDVIMPLYYKCELSQYVKAIYEDKNLLKGGIPWAYAQGKRYNTYSSLSEKYTEDDCAADFVSNSSEVVIYNQSGSILTDGFKIRFIRVSEYENDRDDNYKVIIYHNIDPGENYYVKYKNSDNITVTELLGYNLIFTKTDSLQDITDADFTDDIYHVVETSVGNDIYVPTNITPIESYNRTPYNFRYKVLCELNDIFKGDLKSTNLANHTINAGVYSLYNNENYNSSKTVINTLLSSGLLPENIKIINPHPSSKYINAKYDDNIKDVEYFEIDLDNTQEIINDYDIIFIVGTGNHDLSPYNAVLRSYLEDGGNIFIDNPSNTIENSFNVTFGSLNPIISYSYTLSDDPDNLILDTSAKAIIDVNHVMNKRYNIKEADASILAFKENNLSVCPKTTITLQENQSWIDFIKYRSGNKAFGYVQYKDRGKVYFSTNGLLQGFVDGINNILSNYFANVFLTICERKFICTSWISDRVFRSDTVKFPEKEKLNYKLIPSYDYKNIYAKEIISNLKDFMKNYTTENYSNYDGNYSVLIEEYINNSWNKPVNILSTISQDKVFVYPRLDVPSANFNIDSETEKQLIIYDKTINYIIDIVPYTYAWVEDISGVIKKIKLESSVKHHSRIRGTIKYSDGIKTIDLASSLDGLPEGFEWACGRTKMLDHVVKGEDIYFDISAKFLASDGSLIDYDDMVNIFIYDKINCTHIRSSEGKNVVPYNIVFKQVAVDSNLHGIIIKNNDIVLKIQTNYYDLAINKRIFTVRNKSFSKGIVSLPKSFNTNENWNASIKYINFVKKGLTKDEIDNTVKSLRYRFSPKDAAKVIRDYFSDTKFFDAIDAILSKLDANKQLTDEEWCLVSEAFNVKESNTKFYYHLKEYHNQPWFGEEPYKKVKDEYAKFIDEHTMQLQRQNVFVQTIKVTRQKLNKISEKIFKTVNGCINPSEDIVLEVEDDNSIGGYRIVGPEEYTINFRSGLIKLNNDYEIIYATYYYSNLEIYKKTFENLMSSYEELNQIDSVTYDIPSITKEFRILDSKPVEIYACETFTELQNSENPSVYRLDNSRFVVDYDDGYVTLNNPSNLRLFATYEYEGVEVFQLDMIDSYNSLIRVKDYLNFNDNIYATYIYEDDNYEYLGYFEGDNFIKLDFNPTRGHECTVKENNSYIDIPSLDIVGKTVYFYMYPYRTSTVSYINYERLRPYPYSDNKFYLPTKHEVLIDSILLFTKNGTKYNPLSMNFSIEDNMIVLENEIDETLYMSYNYNNVVFNNGPTIRHTFDLSELNLLQMARPEIILLGHIKVTNPYSKNDLSMIDVRQRGGGLKKSVSSEIINNIDKSASNFWDIANFDGPKYYGNGIITISIPSSILIENGGMFSKSQVEEIAKEQLAFGIVPIINYYQEN